MALTHKSQSLQSSMAEIGDENTLWFSARGATTLLIQSEECFEAQGDKITGGSRAAWLTNPTNPK